METTMLKAGACALLLIPAPLLVARAEAAVHHTETPAVMGAAPVGAIPTSQPESPVAGLGAPKVKVTTSPQTARIYVDGVLTGTGKVVVTIAKGICRTVEVKLEGYIEETRSYCNQAGMTLPPKTDYVKLREDESYTASVQSNIANNEILVTAKKGKSREEAWKSVIQTVLGKFDALENNDERAGYLRTAWVGVVFASSNNTIRTRVVVKQSSDDPIAYKIKFVSEESGKAGTPFGADELYRPFPRILKQYDGMIEELTTKLAN